MYCFEILGLEGTVFQARPSVCSSHGWLALASDHLSCNMHMQEEGHVETVQIELFFVRYSRALKVSYI